MASGSSGDIYTETLAVFDQREKQYEPLTTPEVADALDANRRTVYKRLRKLVDRGDLETKETGSNSRVWWRPLAEPATTTASRSTGDETGTAESELSGGAGQSREQREAKSGSTARRDRNYDEIFEALPDGVSLHYPTDGSIIDVNQQMCEMLGYTREELLSLEFDALHPDDSQYTSEQAKQYIQQTTTDGPQTFEWVDETKDGDKLPVEIHLRRTRIDGEDRILAVVRDVTERQEREQELEDTNRQLQAVLDNIEASVFIKGIDGRYRLMNREARELVGLDSDTEIVGLSDDDLFPEAIAERIRADDRYVLEQGETVNIEETLPKPEGTQTNLTLKSPLFGKDGAPAGVCAVSTDISERKRRERKLQTQATAMETSIDGMAILDADGEYVFVNDAHVEIYGYDDPGEFLSATWKMCYDEDEIARFEGEIMPTLSEEGGWRGEATGQRKDGTTFPQELSLTMAESGKIICVIRDITDRKEREQKLRSAQQFNQELVENAPFGMFRLDEKLRITYENTRAEEMIGLPEEKDQSNAIGMDIRELPPIIETGQAEIFSQLNDGETVEFEFPFESIYGKSIYFAGRCVPLYRNGEFDGAILMGRDISERKEREHELDRQRQQLAALNELNDVVRGITEAAIEQSTREEIEQVVCERLAASESYQSAWVVAGDSPARLELRSECGLTGHPEDSSLPFDPVKAGPINNAIETREIQVSQNLTENPDNEPVSQYARAHGYRSVAAIPIVHRGTLYGVIGVHSERPDAFAQKEQVVISEVGEVVGHAIAALNRKRALLNEEMLELDIRVPGLLEPREEQSQSHGTIAFERYIPLADGTFLLYGTAPADAIDVFDTMCEQQSHWIGVQTIDEFESAVRFELETANPPVASIVADHGGYFEDARIEDGEFFSTVYLPPGTPVRPLAKQIRETYPRFEVTSQKQVMHEDPLQHHLLETFSEELTEKQKTALEVAYYGGFFEWPRDMSGEEVAESLDIGASTFHHHLRKGEEKLLDVVFAES